MDDPDDVEGREIDNAPEADLLEALEEVGFTPLQYRQLAADLRHRRPTYPWEVTVSVELTNSYIDEAVLSIRDAINASSDPEQVAKNLLSCARYMDMLKSLIRAGLTLKFAADAHNQCYIDSLLIFQEAKLGKDRSEEFARARQLADAKTTNALEQFDKLDQTSLGLIELITMK